MKVRLFKGTVPWEEYLTHFTAVASTNNWDYAECGRVLACSLEGTALQVSMAAPRQCGPYDFDEICSILNKYFGSNERSELYLTELRCLVRKEGESLHELSHRIMSLIRQSFTSASSADVQRIAVNYFCDALEDRGTRMEIFKSGAISLDSAVKIASSIEAFKKMEDIKRPVVGRRFVREVREEQLLRI